MELGQKRLSHTTSSFSDVYIGAEWLSDCLLHFMWPEERPRSELFSSSINLYYRPRASDIKLSRSESIMVLELYERPGIL